VAFALTLRADADVEHVGDPRQNGFVIVNSGGPSPATT
jgi:hypothetical protein